MRRCLLFFSTKARRGSALCCDDSPRDCSALVAVRAVSDSKSKSKKLATVRKRNDKRKREQLKRGQLEGGQLEQGQLEKSLVAEGFVGKTTGSMIVRSMFSVVFLSRSSLPIAFSVVLRMHLCNRCAERGRLARKRRIF